MTTIYQEALAFAKEHIEPIAKEIDESKEFPKEVFAEIGKAGFLQLFVPTQFGGKGLTYKEHAEVCMAFSQASASVGLCYMMHNVALNVVVNNGSDELVEKICRDVMDNNHFLALAYSEAGTGTHFYIPEMKAEFLEGKVHLTGRKSMVTSAENASYYLVLAPAEQEGAIDNWVVPIESEGVSFEMAEWNGLGMRGNASAPMNVDTILDHSWRVGAPGSGQDQVFTDVAVPFVLGLAAVYSGLSMSLFQEASHHTTSRKYPDGKTLANLETVQIHLADIYNLANAARAATRDAAEAIVNGDEDAVTRVFSARVFASEGAIEAARIAMRVGGGKSYNKANAIERLLRDAYASQIMAPGVDVLKLWTGRALTGQDLL